MVLGVPISKQTKVYDRAFIKNQVKNHKVSLIKQPMRYSVRL